MYGEGAPHYPYEGTLTKYEIAVTHASRAVGLPVSRPYHVTRCTTRPWVADARMSAGQEDCSRLAKDMAPQTVLTSL